MKNLRALALPGAKVRVSWDYDELNPSGIADKIQVGMDPPLFGPLIEVKYVPTQRSYLVEITSTYEGLMTISVTSLRANQSEQDVPSVTVRLDGTPPPVTTLALSVV